MRSRLDVFRDFLDAIITSGLPRPVTYQIDDEYYLDLTWDPGGAHVQVNEEGAWWTPHDEGVAEALTPPEYSAMPDWFREIICATPRNEL